MANMKQKIDNHNRKIMSNGREREEVTRTCNCRDKTLCPLKGKCLQEGVVYKAIATQTETMKQDIYIGMTENPFKTRYNLHNSSFRLPHKRSTTTLSEQSTKQNGPSQIKQNHALLLQGNVTSASQKNTTYYQKNPDY